MGWFPSTKTSVRGAQQPVGQSGRHIEEGSAFNRHIIRTVHLCLCLCVLDLGPPALYELGNLGDVESTQLEVM